MFCNQCGSIVPDGAKFCPKCGAPVEIAQPVEPTEPVQPAEPAQPVPPTPQPAYAPSAAPAQACPPNHLVKSIIFTCLLCWPFGIPAIVNAAGVNSAYNSGNYELAAQKSANAQKWCKTTLIVGIIFWAVYLTIIIIAAIFA